MESQSVLGLYIGKKKGTAVCLHKGDVAGSVSVSVERDQEATFSSLLHRLMDRCREKQFQYTDVSVSLDSALYMQHRIHSQFSQAKQISATIRFDTEEAAAADISHLAVSFATAEATPEGTKLDVFTAEQETLSDILMTLQGQGMDPLRIIPDVCCLTRLVERNLDDETSPEAEPLVGIVSKSSGYFLRKTASAGVLPLRAFPVGSTQNRTDLLAREGFTTMASTAGGRIERFFIYDSAGEIDLERLSKRLGVPVSALSWFESGPWSDRAREDDAGMVDYAIAYSTALLSADAAETLDFRHDFMPYQGKKIRLQRAMKWACISLTLLMLALGGRLQASWFMAKSDRDQLKETLEEDYLMVMPGKTDISDYPIRDLERAIRTVRNVQGGRLDLEGNQSTLAKLQVVLKAITECHKKAGLDFDSISIGRDVISINGSTVNAQGRLDFKEALQQQGIGIAVVKTMTPKGGRFPFAVTIQGGRTQETP